MGEGGRSVREVKLIEFQQRLGGKITPDDLVDKIEYSQNPKSMRQQKWRKGKKKKQDYLDLLKELRAKAKGEN